MYRTACVLLFALVSSPLLAEDFKPSVPLLELKRHDGAWTWMRGDQTVATHDQDLERLFYAFSIYKDKETGWHGLRDGRTTNLALIHVAQNAPEDMITAMLRRARKSNLPQIAIACDRVEPALDARKAPLAHALPPEYRLFELFGELTENAVGVYLENSTGGRMFSVGRKEHAAMIASGSEADTDDLQLDPADDTVRLAGKTAARERVINALVEALAVKLAVEADVEALHVVGHKDESAAPWIWFELAARACDKLNAQRKAAGLDVLPVQWLHTYTAEGEVSTGRPQRREDRRFQWRIESEGSERPHATRMVAALEWLKDHQNREGFWSATEFTDDSVRTRAARTYNIEFRRVGEPAGDKGWEGVCDIGLTGLALLAYAGAGYDHRDGDYRAVCRKAVLFLRRHQDNDGCFGPKEDDLFVYSHAICTMALAEVYGLSGDQVLKPIVDKAVEFILLAQNPGLGWRYGVRPGVNDSSVTSWMVMALRSASLAGIEVDTQKSFDDAATWFKLVTIDVNGVPQTGYDSPGSNNARLRSAADFDSNPTMDAIYATCMTAMGKADATDKTVKALTDKCIQADMLPRWAEYRIDFYYWYYASLACHQAGGDSWTTWEKAVSKHLLDYQRGWHSKDEATGRSTAESLDEHGSWDPVGAWGQAGGRVYSTAMGALILQTSYRYQRTED